MRHLARVPRSYPPSPAPRPPPVPLSGVRVVTMGPPANTHQLLFPCEYAQLLGISIDDVLPIIDPRGDSKKPEIFVDPLYRYAMLGHG